MNFDPDPADLALSSVPGHETFDPRKHRFSEEELKPQPIMKKARKIQVPDEQKVRTGHKRFLYHVHKISFPESWWLFRIIFVKYFYKLFGMFLGLRKAFPGISFTYVNLIVSFRGLCIFFSTVSHNSVIIKAMYPTTKKFTLTITHWCETCQLSHVLVHTCITHQSQECYE